MYIAKLNLSNANMDKTNLSFFAKLKKGQCISPLIIDKQDNQLTVKQDKTTFKLNFNGNVTEKIGDFINLKVISNKQDNCQLEYIQKNNQRNNKLNSSVKYDDLRESLKSIGINASNKNLDIAKIMKQNKINISKQQFEKVQQLEKQVSNVVTNIDEKSLNNAKELGYSLDKITMDIMSKIIKYTKDEENLSEEEIQNKIKTAVSEYKDIFKDEKQLNSIIEKLTKAGITVTKDTINQCINFNKVIDQFNNIDYKAINYLIRNNKELSIQNIYQAIHSTRNLSQLDNKATLEQLTEQQLIKFIKSLGLQVNDNILTAAKQLLKNDLDISVNNIYKVIKLNSLNNLSDQDKDDLLRKAVKLLKQDKSLISFNFNDEVENNTDNNQKKPLTDQRLSEIIDKLPSINENDIKRVLNSNIELNLSNLLNKSDGKAVIDDYSQNEDYTKEQKLITAKRQVEEIRLKLTVEAANKLNSKSINIDTAPLEDLVDELRNIEKETYAEHLDKVGAKVTDNNITSLKNVMDTVSYLKQSNNVGVAKVSNHQIPFELNEIAMTTPDSYYGDSFKKIEDQIRPLLQQLGINDTEANVRAASILIKNDMEVNVDQLEHVKMLDQKVLDVTNKLQPSTAAHMIKDGINPLNMHVDEVIQYINNFQDEYGVNTKEQIAEYIVQMDKQQVLSNQERQGMIAIYRMLNTIQQSEGKAVGFLFKNNLDFTLENLMESAKFLDKNKNLNESIDVSINDDFGMLSKIKGTDNNIRQRLLDVLNKANMAPTDNNMKIVKDMILDDKQITSQNLIKHTINTNMLEQLEQILSPKAIEWLNNNLSQYEQMNIEQLIDQLKMNKTQFNEKLDTDNQIRDIISSLKGLKGNQSTLLKFMSENNIKPSIENLALLKENMNNEFFMGDLFNEIDEVLDKNNKSEFKMSKNIKNDEMNTINELDDDLKEHINKVTQEAIAFNDTDRDVIIKDSFQLDRLANMQKSMDSLETSFYQIPIVYQDQATNLNMYVLNDKETNVDWEDKKLKAIFSLKTNNLGTIRCLMTVDNRNVQFDFQTEKQSDKDFISQYTNQLKDAIKNIGYSLVDTQYDVVPYKNIYQNLTEQPVEKSAVKKYQNSKIEITI